jgi:phosphohistidine phosphatase
MDLILWRHAQAHPAQAGQSDLERPLTRKGRRQAGCMAAWLQARLPRATVWVSPAQRTLQTAAAWAKAADVAPVLAPEALPHDVLRAVQHAQVPVHHPLVLVGHQPTLGQLAALLMGGQVQDWAIRKGAVWWLRHDAAEGSTRWTLRAMRGPDEL